MAESAPPIPIDYSSRDYAALRADLVGGISTWLPEWTNRTESDFGIVMIEMFSYIGDILGYYTDRVANEAFITTAVQRASVLSLASMIDYRPAGLAAATTTLTITISDSAGGPVTIPAGTKVSTVPEAGDVGVVFETDDEITIAVGASDTVDATEGESHAEDSASPVGVSDGSADQVFSLFYADIIDGTLTVFVDEDGAGPGTEVTWREVTHMIDATSEDRVYTSSVDENGITYLRFGDDANGRIPTSGAIITATYRVGVGADGNVGANTLIELVAPIVGVDDVTNAGSATGGADVESLASIRRQAPRSLTVLERAVTTDDYALLASKVAGVLHAKATASAYTSVQIAVAPLGGGVPSTGLKNTILNDLSTKKMINTSVSIVDPTYVPINVTVNPLNVLPQYNKTTTQTAVENAIIELFEVQNVSFGYRVTLSAIYAAVQAVPGVDYAVITVLSTTGSGLADVTVADDEIPSDGTISVTSTGGLIGS